MWCNEFGGNSAPSFFLTSKINLVSQNCSICVVIPVRGGRSTRVEFILYFRHSSKSPVQYFVSCWVFFGTPCSLALSISSVVFGIANRLVGGTVKLHGDVYVFALNGGVELVAGNVSACVIGVAVPVGLSGVVVNSCSNSSMSLPKKSSGSISHTFVVLIAYRRCYERDFCALHSITKYGST